MKALLQRMQQLALREALDGGDGLAATLASGVMHERTARPSTSTRSRACRKQRCAAARIG
jgi:hypothetical protein